MIATALLEAALRSLIMGAAVLAGLRMFGVRHVLARKIAWMLVLFASLAMPFLVRWQAFRVKPLLSVPEHWLSAQTEKRPAQVEVAKSEAAVPESASPETAAVLPVTTPAVSLDTPMTAQAAATQSWHMNWSEIRRWIVPAYLTVAVLLLMRLLIGFALALRIWYRAERASPILEPRAWVRISTAVNAPVTIGSGIVLPENYREWDRAKLRAVLAHERSHVRQGDFYLQLLAGIYTAIFWFSPLGWWMQRELSDAAEAISDRAALSEVGNRSSYAEVLLEFAAMPRRSVAGVAMARSGNIQKRIDRLLTENLFRMAFVGFRRHAALAALLVPVALVAATSVVRVDAAGQMVLPNDVRGNDLRDNDVRDQEKPVPAEVQPPETPKVAVPPAEPAPPTPAPAVTTAVPEVTKAVPLTKLTAVPGAMPQMGTVITAVEVPKIKLDLGEIHRVIPVIVKQEEIRVMEPATLARLKIALPPGLQVADSATAGDSYAILSDDDPTVYGSIADWKAFTKDKARLQGNCIWFERDGKQYVIDDPALAAQARELFRPIEELGKQQADLGKQQAALGKEQGKLALKQMEVSVPLPDMTAEIRSLEEELKTLQDQSGKEFSQQDIGRLQAKIGELQGKFSAMQVKIATAKIEAKQSEFGAQQSALGEQQSELGKQQSELGRQQSKLSKEADSRMKIMIDDAIKNGKAKPVN